jgi:E3 ubiquitin-protein ligase MYCBP2
LNEDCVKVAGGNDQKSDDFCNICWVEALEASPCIQLDCGHVFHYDCIAKKVSNKWAGAMITFGYLDCPLCKKRVSHPSLAAELQPALALYEDVKAKALARLKFMNMQDAKELKEKGPYYNDPEKYAMARFCFYPCFKCNVRHSPPVCFRSFNSDWSGVRPC